MSTKTRQTRSNRLIPTDENTPIDANKQVETNITGNEKSVLSDKEENETVISMTETEDTPEANIPEENVEDDPDAVVSEELDEEAQQAYLEQMFEEQTASKIKSLGRKTLGLDKKVLKAKLKPHQVDGIRWLVNQEKSTRPNPFFKTMTYKSGTTSYRCSLTGLHQKEAPKPIQGALLADDMGLGKTLQTLGLILLNKPEAGSAGKATLIVSPVSAMANWAQQANQHVKKGHLNVCLYQGPKRNKLVPDIINGEYDIVVTSYETLRADFSATNKDDEKQTVSAQSLFCAQYHRIVIDEAHLIRSPSSKFFKAVSAVKASNKVALTGTPFVNKPEDLWALMSFLGVEPLQSRLVFEEQITNKIKQGRPCGLARIRAAMSHLSLRRTKKTIDLGLEPKTTKFIKIPFSPGPHNEIHSNIYETARKALTAILKDGNNDSRKDAIKVMFFLNIRIRQACCSGELFPVEFREQVEDLADQFDEAGTLTAEQGWDVLSKLQSISKESMTKKSTAKSGNAIDDVAAKLGGISLSGDKKKKPLKKASGKVLDLPPSPKVEALLRFIEMEMKPDEKGVIFSNFTSFLDLIEPTLKEHGITFTRLDGSMSAEKRLEAMSQFDDDDGPRMILCSMKAAGLGISLTRGNFAFMMDPWWNQASEDQAADRVHRLGQTRPVSVFRFVMKDSIEERLVSIQSRKAALGKGSMEKLSAKEEKRAQLTAMEDLFDVNIGGDRFWDEFADSDDEFIVGNYND